MNTHLKRRGGKCAYVVREISKCFNQISYLRYDKT
jgi:hypothetical protein